MSHAIREHSVRNAVLLAAIAGLASAFRREMAAPRHVPRIGETALGEPGEVL